MKRSIRIKLAASMVFFSAVAAVSSSIAWFIPTVSLTDTGEITGTTEGAYYAYGEGTEEKPFGITRPRHLYNLAWLQYLGTYNKTSENGKPYYFELGDNVDMSGWILPPIGDENNPFYGNFNGQGYVISNLTISNDFTSDLGKHPSTVTSFNQPHILGFFGVIGKYGGSNPSAYSSSANEFINTGLTGLTVKTVLKDSLVGIAAGYVDATLQNVAVDASSLNVAYSGNDATTSYGGHTANISDFSLVGYTTKKASVKKAEETIYSVNVSSGHEFNATDQGESTGWGGSIDMKSVTQRLQTIRDNLSSTSNFTYYREYNYTDGTLDSGNPVATKKYGDANNDDTPVIVNSNSQIGHFHFINEDGFTERYALLGGGHWEKHNYYQNDHFTDAFKITDGTHYLRITGTTSFEATETAANGNYFALNSLGYLVTLYNNQTVYMRNNNGTLAVTNDAKNASVWELDDSGTNRIIKNGRYTIYLYSNSDYWGDTTYTFDLEQADSTTTNSNPYSIRRGNGNYLGCNGTSLVLSSTEQKIWNVSNPSTSGTTTVSTVINGTTYYLNHNTGNSGLVLTESSFTWTCGTNHRLSYRSGNSTYYVTFRNDEWSVGTSTRNSRADLTYTATSTTTYTYSSNLQKSAKNGSTTIKSLDNVKSGMNYSENDVTYFPLSTVNNTNNFTPSDSNTAYVIGGSSLTEDATFYDDEISNVRFGYYPTSSSFASGEYSSSTGQFSKIYTINNNMQKEDISSSTSFEKLTDARNNLANVMKGQTNVYGLHFMESTISMDSIMTAPYVKVNKTVHENYQLPVNAIDFHLKEMGYINFIAGSYYAGSNVPVKNNSFFALYAIERNDDQYKTIKHILEIKNIYKHTSGNKSYSYVYELTDGTNTFYSKPYRVIDAEGNKVWLYDNDPNHVWEPYQYVDTLPDNYSLIFNCARIKKNNVGDSGFNNHAYYFEIPMNEGEFCLGSASGGVGSYLMYLDIGANAAKTQRTIFYEKFDITDKNYSYPLGVSLYTLPEAENISSNTKIVPLFTDDTSSVVVDASDSACVIIKASAVGEFEIDRNGTDVTLGRGTQSSNAPPRYAGESITLLHENGSSDPIEPVCDSSSTKNIKRMQYYDYNVNLEKTTVTTITDISTVGGSSTRTIYQYNYSSNDTTQTPTTTYAYDQTLNTPVDQRENIKIYNTSSGIKLSSSAMIDTTSSGLPINNSDLSSSSILVFKLVQNGGDKYDDNTLLVAVKNNSITTGIYYVFNQYKITLTPESGTITVTITKYVTGNTIYFGTTPVTGSTQVITIPAP